MRGVGGCLKGQGCVLGMVLLGWCYWGDNGVGERGVRQFWGSSGAPRAHGGVGMVREGPDSPMRPHRGGWGLPVGPGLAARGTHKSPQNPAPKWGRFLKPCVGFGGGGRRGRAGLPAGSVMGLGRLGAGQGAGLGSFIPSVSPLWTPRSRGSHPQRPDGGSPAPYGTEGLQEPVGGSWGQKVAGF